jgi:alpha-1,3-rhamnosyltransferase
MIARNTNPLVSIIVITYNSSKYVLETLESAKAQTYQNIELIISDDCSTDNTVELCNNWLMVNRQRFVNAKIVTSPQNTGIPANCNRGVTASRGEWVKFIAGDDRLIVDCIECNIDFITNEKADLVFSKIRKNYGERIEETSSRVEKEYLNFTRLNSKNQLKFYASHFFSFSLPAPTFFIRKSVIEELNGFDERFSLYEDRPFIIKTLEKKFKWHYLSRHTIEYNVMEGNESLTSSNVFINEKLFSNIKSYYKLVLRKLLVNNCMFLSVIHLRIYFLHINIIIKNGNKKDEVPLSAKLVKLLSPLYILRKVQQLFNY